MKSFLAPVFILLSCNNNSAVKNTVQDSIPPPQIAPAQIDTTEIPGQAIINLSVNTVGLVPHKIHLAKGIDFNLNIPAVYQVSIAAEGLKRLRFLTMSPDRRLFATDMHDVSDNKKGRVLIFNNWNDTLKKFGNVTTYLHGLHNPNQIAFYNNYLYVAETGRLSRYEYQPGDTIPASPAQAIASFPDYGLSYKYGGWHLTRSISFHSNKLYVSVGSSCNACIEKESERAVIIEMNPDGTGKRIYASGLRNSVGMKWIGDKLWVTSMGRDLLGPDKPEDLFLSVEQEGYYGWPFYYQYHNKIFVDAQFKDSIKVAGIKEPPVAFAGFKAHTAPLGFEYMKEFADEDLKNSFLVCLHGSTSVWRMRGNSIVKVAGGNRYVEIVSGFLTGKTEHDRHGRPCDILMKDNKSFYFTDDLNGVLYYVWKQ